jgi:hypothetical protein
VSALYYNDFYLNQHRVLTLNDVKTRNNCVQSTTPTQPVRLI